MAESFGNGVGRTLPPAYRQFLGVVFQDGGIPFEDELNFVGQVSAEQVRDVVRSQCHSGFFLDPTAPRSDFVVDPLCSNQFFLGPVPSFSGVREERPPLVANVNGWIIPLVGTRSSDGISNRVALNPPPSTDSRVDFVFLEVWKALVPPGPSSTNKPSPTAIWKWGNTEFGGTNLPDDLQEPRAGFETTLRVQLQYRFRVVGDGSGGGSTVDLVNYPDGFGDPSVRGRGAATSPSSFTFSNMRREGDPSLWRAGDGNPSNALGTVDGYVYAIPVSAVFRRNSTPFIAVTSSGNPNQNGAVCRTPSISLLSDPRSGSRVLSSVSLASTISPTTVGVVSVAGLPSSDLSDTLFSFPLFATIGDEVVSLSAISVGGGTVTIASRGRGGSPPSSHPSGSTVGLYNSRPDGLFSDQIAGSDILDLRRSVTFGSWDHNQLLMHNLSSLLQGSLSTAWKKSGTGGDTMGAKTLEVAYMWGDSPTPSSPLPNHVSQVDGPDGIRTVWSESAVCQRDVPSILDPNVPLVGGFADTTFNSSVVLHWTAGANFEPWGFLNNPSSNGWANGSVVFFYLGGKSGSDGAHAGFCQSPKPSAARFVSPREMWKDGPVSEVGDVSPWKMRFLGGTSGSSSGNGYKAARITTPAAHGETPAQHPGPMFPTKDSNFERPFIVLGGLVNSVATVTEAASSSNLLNIGGGVFEVRFSGTDFDVEDVWWSKDSSGNFEDDPALVTRPLVGGQKTLYGMLTRGGVDLTGESSEVYLVVYGDRISKDNNGAFRVVGVGQSGMTQRQASSSSCLIVRPLSHDFTSFVSNAGETVVVEMRSQHILPQDDRQSGTRGVAIVMTDLGSLGGGPLVPWGPTRVGALALLESGGYLLPVNSKMVVDSAILWDPSRGASPRNPEAILEFGLRGSDSAYLRNQVSDLDSVFVAGTTFPDSTRVFPSPHVQLWNRLGSLGITGPEAPSYGGSVVGHSEQDRESELFIDEGSRTVVFRPFVQKNMTLRGQTTVASPHPPRACHLPRFGFEGRGWDLHLLPHGCLPHPP